MKAKNIIIMALAGILLTGMQGQDLQATHIGCHEEC